MGLASFVLDMRVACVQGLVFMQGFGGGGGGMVESWTNLTPTWNWWVHIKREKRIQALVPAASCFKGDRSPTSCQPLETIQYSSYPTAAVDHHAIHNFF